MGIVKNKINNIKAKTRKRFINARNQKKLLNKDFSLLASNCNGAFILNELGEQFRSPTVNLFFYAHDFIKFLEKLEYYIECPLVEELDSNYNYPLGRLDDITIHFMHYKSFEQSKKIWEERLTRLNLNNLFIMMTDRDECDEQIIQRFDALPYKNKIIFTHLPYPNIKSAIYIKGFENEKEVGHLYEYTSFFSIKKYYDNLNYVKWFNSGEF